MSPSLPPADSPRPLSLIDVLNCLAVAVGAVVGASWGGVKYGWLGAVIGLPAGAILGVVGTLALLVPFAAVVLVVVIVSTDGPRGLWEFVRGRWVPPDERPGTNQTNESDG